MPDYTFRFYATSDQVLPVRGASPAELADALEALAAEALSAANALRVPGGAA